MERRHSQRVKYHLPVTVTYSTMGAGVRKENTRFINISEGGAYLALDGQPEPASEMELNILAPADFCNNYLDLVGRAAEVVEIPLVIKANGRVVRTVSDPSYPGGVCVGVEFEGPIRIVRVQDE